MKLLLDTLTLLWWLADSPQLSAKARSAVARASTVYVSAVTVWEISIKKACGKLKAPDDLEEALLMSDFAQLPITAAHAWAAGALPLHHHDPFDRMLIAQARAESLTLATRDETMRKYPVRVLSV